MTKTDRRAIAAQIRDLTNKGRHIEAHALWLRTIAPRHSRQ
jgi:hypothetical protein